MKTAPATIHQEDAPNPASRLLQANPVSGFLLAAFLTFSVLPRTAAEEGRTVVDWSEQTPGLDVTSPSPDIYFSVRHEAKPIVAGDQTDPRTPFAKAGRALFVDGPTDTDAVVAIAINPFFYEGSPPKGWVELEFALSDSSLIATSLGVDSSSSESPAVNPQYDGKNLYNLVLRGDGVSTLILGMGEDIQRINLPPRVAIHEPHLLRVAWDWTSDKPGVSFFIDGEPIIGPDLEPYFLPVPTNSLKKGVDRLSIFVYRGGFLGKITASE